MEREIHFLAGWHNAGVFNGFTFCLSLKRSDVLNKPSDVLVSAMLFCSQYAPIR